MKYYFVFGCFIFLTCIGSKNNLRKVTYPIPNNKKILFFHSVSPGFYDSYSEETEISLKIQEELELMGYSIVIGDKLWDEVKVSIPENHLDNFRNQLHLSPAEIRPRTQIWKEQAERVGANEVFILRFCFSSREIRPSIRLVWIHLSNKEINRFDWNWDESNPLPIRESLQKNLGVQP